MGLLKQGMDGSGGDALEGMGALEGRVPHNEGAQLILVPER